ncbi:MAG: hypothetical protein JF593_08805 [Novosphingobium sp.]|nr:hypothetical protein [Novosphingobium sp.]
MFAQVSLALLLVFRIGAVFANYGITPAFLNLQDRWLVLVGLAVAVLSGVAGWKLRRPLGLSATVVAAIALCACVICYLGHYALLLGYDLSRDEQMAVFDARIYAAGRLAWPLPPAWQPDAAMLNLLFMLPVTKPVAWVSGYLPGNAMIRVLIGAVADPALTSPLLTGGSLLLLWSCARKLWPGEREPATVAFLLLACSAQVLLMGMTAYAMPAHLFFNLLWLRLFLANRRIADLGASDVGHGLPCSCSAMLRSPPSGSPGPLTSMRWSPDRSR